MANLYTSPNGQTIPGQQYDSNQLSMRDMSSAQLGALSNQQAQATATLQSPETRTLAIDNSTIPAQQANYEELAKQLYQYDQMNLAPKYGGTPTVQPGAASFGRVGASTLSQLTPEAVASGTVGLSNSNPEYGIKAQVNQGNLLTNLLAALNTGISDEFTAKRGSYKSSVDKSQTQLNTILGYLDRADAREQAAQDRAERAAERAADKADTTQGKLQTLAQQLKSQSGADGFVSPESYTSIKKTAAGLGILPSDFDSQFSGYRNPSNLNYRLEATALTGAAKTQATAAKTGLDLLNGITSKYDLSKLKTGPINGLMSDVTKNQAPNWTDKDLLTFESDFGPIRDQLINAISGASVSPAEAERLKQWLPDKYKSSQVNAANLVSLRTYLSTVYKNNTGLDYKATTNPKGGGDSGRPPLSSFDK